MGLRDLFSPGKDEDDEKLYRTDGKRLKKSTRKSTDNQAKSSAPQDATPTTSKDTTVKQTDSTQAKDDKPATSSEPVAAAPVEKSVAQEPVAEKTETKPVEPQKPDPTATDTRDGAPDTVAATQPEPEPAQDKKSRILGAYGSSGDQYGYYMDKNEPAKEEPTPTSANFADDQPLSESAAAAAAFLAAQDEDEEAEPTPSHGESTAVAPGLTATSSKGYDDTRAPASQKVVQNAYGKSTTTYELGALKTGAIGADSPATRDAQPSDRGKPTEPESKYKEDFEAPPAIITSDPASSDQPKSPKEEKGKKKGFLGIFKRDKKDKADKADKADKGKEKEKKPAVEPVQHRPIGSTTAVKDAPLAVGKDTDTPTSKDDDSAALSAAAAAAAVGGTAAAAGTQDSPKEETEKPLDSNIAAADHAMNQAEEPKEPEEKKATGTQMAEAAAGVAIAGAAAVGAAKVVEDKPEEQPEAEPAAPVKELADEREAEAHREEPGSPIKDLAERPSDSVGVSSTPPSKGPHSSDTANRLDPSVPLETPGDEIPGAFPQPTPDISEAPSVSADPVDTNETTVVEDEPTTPVTESKPEAEAETPTATSHAVEVAKEKASEYAGAASAAGAAALAGAAAYVYGDKESGEKAGSLEAADPANYGGRSKNPITGSDVVGPAELNPYAGDVDPRVDATPHAVAAHGGASQPAQDTAILGDTTTGKSQTFDPEKPSEPAVKREESPADSPGKGKKEKKKHRFSSLLRRDKKDKREKSATPEPVSKTSTNEPVAEKPEENADKDEPEPAESVEASTLLGEETDGAHKHNKLHKDPPQSQVEKAPEQTA